MSNEYCKNGDNAILVPVVSGGTFSGNGVTGNAFNPASAVIGINSITYSITDGNSCSNSSSVDVTVIDLPDNTVTQTDLTITSNATGTVTYQWVNCNTGFSEITGETGASFTATANGSYAVVVTEGNCSDTSACVVISTVGLHHNRLLNAVSLYPNPTTGTLTIELTEATDIRVHDMTGKLVYANKLSDGKQTIVLPATINSGTYMMSLTQESGNRNIRFVVNR